MNIAIIGCGAIAVRRHAPAIARHPDAHFYAVCDPVKENADRLAGEYGVKAFYDIGELLADENVDAVHICTPERFHCSNVVAALRAGKHVLCEKPLAMNKKEAEEIVKVWEASGKKLMVAFSQRMYEEHQIAKKLLDEGAIGKPISFRTKLAHRGAEYAGLSGKTDDFYDKRLAGIGNVMLSVGCHRVDLVKYLFGNRIHRVLAYTPTIDKTYADGTPIEAADHAMIIMELENGLSGTMWVSWCAYGEGEVGTYIYGTEGSISIYEKPGVVLRKKDGTVERYETVPNPDEGGIIVSNFLDMLCGREKAADDGYDGLDCMKVLDAVERADKEGCWITVD